MLVSIIIPNYNHALFLNQRINSVLNQTFQNFEVIILDDCSKDNSREIVEQYRLHPKVSHIVYNEQNSGSTFIQWSKGINLAKGDLIWIAESDDYCEPQLLAELIDKFNQDTNLVISYAQSYQVDEKGVVLGDMSFHTDPVDLHHWKSDYRNDGILEIKNYLLYRNTIPNASAVLFRKSAYYEISKAFEKMRLCGDWMFWIQLLKKGNIYFCSRPLNYFRTHPNTTRVLDNYQKQKFRLEEEYEVALTINELFTKQERNIYIERLNAIAKNYSFCFNKSQLLRYIIHSALFNRSKIFYQLLKFKASQIA